jgi:L-iditol 2-dehydrogenase
MKAAIYYGPGDIRIEEIKDPRANPEGAVVKIKACGVCPIIDLKAWISWPANGQGVGLACGHEWSGELVEVGSQVSDFKVGDRVYVEPVFRPCHRCDSCLRGDYWRCSNWSEGTGVHGGFAEYIWLPFLSNDGVIKLPETLSYRDLTMIEPLGLASALAKKAKTSDVVVVIGQELIGLGTVAFLKKMGVAKVIASDVSPKRLEASREIGADVVVDELNEDIVRVVRKETAGRGADVVIQAEHSPITLLESIGAVRRGGRVWLAGAYSMPLALDPSVSTSTRYAVGADWHGYIEPPLTFDPSLLYMRSTWGTCGPRIPRWLEVIELLQSGKITAAKHITHVFPLEKTKEAFNTALNSSDVIRALVEIR